MKKLLFILFVIFGFSFSFGAEDEQAKLFESLVEKEAVIAEIQPQPLYGEDGTKQYSLAVTVQISNQHNPQAARLIAQETLAQVAAICRDKNVPVKSAAEIHIIVNQKEKVVGKIFAKHGFWEKPGIDLERYWLLIRQITNRKLGKAILFE